MPKNRPGRMHQPVTATKDIPHGSPAVEDNLVGIAVKQLSPAWDTAYADVTTIKNGEPFALIAKGIVEVPTFTGAAKGVMAYVAEADGSLSTTNTDPVFGRVIEVPADGRGVPTGKVRIDLDTRV